MLLKRLLSLLWVLLCLGAVVVSYDGAWQHNWVLLILALMPQAIALGYNMGKGL